MRRLAFLGRPLLRIGVPGAAADADEVPAKFVERLLQVFLQIVGQGAERRDVDCHHPLRQLSGLLRAGEKIEDAEEGGEGLAGAGGGGDKHGLAGEHCGQGTPLRFRKRSESFFEPLRQGRVQLSEQRPVGGRRQPA